MKTRLDDLNIAALYMELFHKDQKIAISFVKDDNKTQYLCRVGSAVFISPAILTPDGNCCQVRNGEICSVFRWYSLPELDEMREIITE